MKMKLIDMKIEEYVERVSGNVQTKNSKVEKKWN
jgi:hypothetical protein